MSHSKKSHPGQRRPRYTRMDIQDSNRLRIVAVRAGWPTADIAAACGCSIEHAKKWLSDQHVLSPLYAAGIKRRWPQETASP